MTGKKWDLLDTVDQRRAWTLFHKTKPALLIASPPCTVFSILQRMNSQPGEEGYKRAVAMVELAVDMCIAQHKAGRLFVFEHPATASSWKLQCLQHLSKMENMYEVDFDMCRFGMKVMTNTGEEGLAKKTTKVYTNSEAIYGLLASM